MAEAVVSVSKARPRRPGRSDARFRPGPAPAAAAVSVRAARPPRPGRGDARLRPGPARAPAAARRPQRAGRRAHLAARRPQPAGRGRTFDAARRAAVEPRGRLWETDADTPGG